MQKKSWQRLTLSIIGIVCAMVIWEISIEKLAWIPDAKTSAFTTLTVNTQYVIGAIIIFMVTGRLVYDWKNSTTSEVVTQTEQIFTKAERIPAPKHFDDNTLP